MQLAPTAYIYPPRTKLVTPIDSPAIRFLQQAGYRAQYKFNDSHAILTCVGGEYKLWSRHADYIQNYTILPELHAQMDTMLDKLGLSRDGHHRFDGGLLQFKHTAIRHTLVIWDCLVLEGEYLTGTTYESRFARLQAIATGDTRLFRGGDYELHVGNDVTADIFIPHYLDDWDAAWTGLTELNKAYEQPLIEGIVMKDPQGTLTPNFSESNKCPWMAKSRVLTKRHNF